MQGRRIYYQDLHFWADAAHSQPLASTAAGDYWLGPYGWIGKAPNGLRCALLGHRVTEHDDGTISVSPSIRVTDGEAGHQWHGYLERGVWREC